MNNVRSEWSSSSALLKLCNISPYRASDVARSVVCVSVCLCIEHMDELRKNGWTNRDAVWGLKHCPRNHVGILDNGQFTLGTCCYYISRTTASAAATPWTVKTCSFIRFFLHFFVPVEAKMNTLGYTENLRNLHLYLNESRHYVHYCMVKLKAT